MTRSSQLARARHRLLAVIAAVTLGFPSANAAGQDGSTKVLDGFESAEDWTAVPSDGVAMHLSNEDGPHGQALRIDFDLSGGGYAIVRRKFDLELPPNYAFTFAIRGRASRNNLEFKLVDPSGENVWWYNQRNVEFPTTWTTFSRKKRQMSFAWGPQGGGEIRRVAAIEIAITAGQGGRGTVWLDDLSLTTLPVVSGPPRIVSARGATETRAHAAALVIDGNAATAWRPVSTTGSLTMDLGDSREIGGLDITWEKGRAPARYSVLASTDGKRWNTIYRAGATWGERALVWTPEAEARYLRLDVVSGPKAIAGVAEAAVKPLEWAATPNEFAMAAATAAPRGTYPRSLLGIQSYWTAFGVDRDSSEALLNEDGALEPFSGSFSVEPFVRIGDSLFTWANVDRTPSLPTGFLPFPQVEWKHGTWSLAIAPFEGGTAGTSTTYAQYRLRNNGTDSVRATLALALRAFQVNPPWQFLQTPGGVSPVYSITYAKNRLKVNGQRDVIPLKPPSRVAMSTFDAGDVVERLRSGSLVSRASVTDSGGRASAVLLYDVILPPGKSDTVIIALPSAEAVLTKTVAPTADSVAGVLEYQRQRWTTRLTGMTLQLPAEATPMVQTLRASLASMLIMRDGPALRPGARSYARSWIRDGAMMAAALLRLGQSDVVREYADWYANYQYRSGKVPCCVDARGADPVPENDSHGEFIYLVAEYVRFTGDTAFARQMWRHVSSAVDYIDSLRTQRLTSAYAERDSLPYRGLMPQSISHEGYSAKPMHSYWDDFWTMRGLKDAAELARLIRSPDQARYVTLRDAFRRDLVASVTRAMALHHIEYIPGSVELGDFDATSTTIAVSPVDELAALPTDPVTRTFDRYFTFFERRRDGREKWENYTPYELRLMGTFVRLGDRDRAWALARFFLADQRPAAWRQWAEVVWRNRDEPKFIGDLPHAWVASDFARSFLDFFAFERERDTALVVAAGVPGAWLAPGSPFQIAGLHTYYGTLRLGLRRDGRTVRVELGGVRAPPGGIVLALPWNVPVRSVRDEAGRDIGEVRGREIRLRSAPAVVIVTYGADPPDR